MSMLILLSSKLSGRGFPAAGIAIRRLERLEDSVGCPDDSVKRRLEGCQLFVRGPSCHISKRIFRRVKAKGPADDIGRSFCLYFAGAAVCICLFGTFGVQESVCDLVDHGLDALHLSQAVTDDNALVSMAVIAVGRAVCDRLNRYRHRGYGQKRIPDVGIVIDGAGQLTRRAFRQRLAVGLRYVEAICDMVARAGMDLAGVVVNVLDDVRRDDLISQQYIHREETLETTMQSIRSVLTPETAESEYAIRTKINNVQKERKTLIAKALAENDDGKYDFQFARIKQEFEQLQSQLEGVQAMQKTRAVDEARMAEIAALLEKFKENGLSFDDLLVRKVVETVRVESAEKLEITFKDGNRRVVPISEGR